MGEVSRLLERQAFNQADYLELYPDLHAAFEAGKLRNLWYHYDRYGRDEKRAPLRFDAAFYQRVYPQVTAELGEGLADTPLQHFILYGKGRGYLPHAKAVRADNPAASSSRFGGLWINSADAQARIRGRLETGQITEAQAEGLHFFATNGYFILESAINAEVLDAALADFDLAHQGGIPQLRFECHKVDRGHIAWRREVNQHPAKALDIHFFSRPIRNLIFSRKVTDFLGLLFESKALASQTLGILRGSAQEGRRIPPYVPYTLARSFVASWIALEDVTLGAGELFYYVGSHRLDDFLYQGKYKSMSEARRLAGPEGLQQQAHEHIATLEALPRQLGMKKQQFAAKRGDVLIRHADLIHGGNLVSTEATRKSVVTHYCPKYTWYRCLLESQRVGYYDHDGHWFTTGHYTSFDPFD